LAQAILVAPLKSVPLISPPRFDLRAAQRTAA